MTISRSKTQVAARLTTCIDGGFVTANRRLPKMKPWSAMQPGFFRAAKLVRDLGGGRFRPSWTLCAVAADRAFAHSHGNSAAPDPRTAIDG
jgi:hypothetical protein